MLRFKSVSRTVTQVLACVQGLLAGLGFLGVFAYLTEDRRNPSRYQFLFVPAWTFLLALPLLIISAILYRRCRAQMTSVERWVFIIGCALPLVVIGTVIVVSGVGW